MSFVLVKGAATVRFPLRPPRSHRTTYNRDEFAVVVPFKMCQCPFLIAAAVGNATVPSATRCAPQGQLLQFGHHLHPCRQAKTRRKVSLRLVFEANQAPASIGSLHHLVTFEFKDAHSYGASVRRLSGYFVHQQSLWHAYPYQVRRTERIKAPFATRALLARRPLRPESE